MYGDFSRVTYDPAKQYTGVLYQQGRVRLDAEDNEQQAIQAASARIAMADLVGPGAGPAGDLGFQIDRSDTKLFIGPGSYYVDGIRVVNPAETQYATQPYLVADAPGELDLPDGPFLAYLRVQERLVTATQDPALREVALGDLAPDTAARSQVIWQVLIAEKLGDIPIEDGDVAEITAAFEQWRESTVSVARLVARAKQDTPDSTPCVLSPDSEYRGPENQLYRVEVHEGQQFKWSRDNGSVTFPVTSVEAAVVTVTTLGRDGKTALEAGDWVELVDDNTGLNLLGTQRDLVQVTAVDTVELTVTLESAPTGVLGPHPMLRRWDGQGTISAEFITLEDGVQVEFSLAGKGNFRPGDYWLFPARVATGDVQWPKDPSGKPIPQPPAGVIPHYAPLAVIRPDAQPEELRDVFAPISTPYQRPKPTRTQPEPTTPTSTTAATPAASGPTSPVPAAPTPVAPGPAAPTSAPSNLVAMSPAATGNPTANNRIGQSAPLIYPGPAPASAA